jgi:flagellar hook-length control protein FliK
MVKDGGGEMKVVLTPEGLGEVAMKVNVKDGKVNVEMITQTDEAKKVLENGFRALSEGLKAHHLNLESIQVNSANSLSTQLEQQYRDAQRHQAQQFLEQFHQDNQGWRQSYFDIPGAQTYRSQQNRASVGPQILSNPSANSRRLDLVA